MVEKERFTPTQQRMLAVLSDGKPHKREELHACCGPSTCTTTVQTHIHFLRKKLQRVGHDIVCVKLNTVTPPQYRHVIMLPQAEE